MKYHQKPLEDRVTILEREWNAAKPVIADLAKQFDLQRTRVDLWRYCRDKLDRDIMNYLIDNLGAGATEIAQALNLTSTYARHVVGKRLLRIQRDSNIRNEPFLEFDPAKRENPSTHDLKYRAWWLQIEEVDVADFKKKMEQKEV